MGEWPNKDAQFKKGESGNPNGRPKRPDINESIDRVLSEEQGGMNAVDAIFKSLLNRAIRKGDVKAAQELLDRGYGKVKQPVDISSLGEKLTSITVEVITKATDSNIVSNSDERQDSDQ